LKKKRQSHKYTSELELKTLLIRVNNKTKETNVKHNNRINRYTKLYVKISNMKYPLELMYKKKKARQKLKALAIKLSENTNIDTDSYERFGEIILLMIKNILKKPNFAGYTYKDDFYSDAIHKILKYLHNFNHTLISERSGQFVNSFAYISQIIHNSVIYIINIKKKEQVNLKNQVSLEIVDHNLNMPDYDKNTSSTYFYDKEHHELKPKITIKANIISTFVNFLKMMNFQDDTKYIIEYSNYKISMQEYDELKPFLKFIDVKKVY